MIHSLCYKSDEEKLARLNMLTIEQRRLRGKLRECFEILERFTDDEANKLFIIDDLSRARSNEELKCIKKVLD